ncbi:hypothetical protein B0H13DRAFT_2385575 [Mycena leptocephala]|nr:hypothetical protein B0H13DRAFT_2385575 [Mycena leptocephala]
MASTASAYSSSLQATKLLANKSRNVDESELSEVPEDDEADDANSLKNFVVSDGDDDGDSTIPDNDGERDPLDNEALADREIVNPHMADDTHQALHNEASESENEDPPVIVDTPRAVKRKRIHRGRATLGSSDEEDPSALAKGDKRRRSNRKRATVYIAEFDYCAIVWKFTGRLKRIVCSHNSKKKPAMSNEMPDMNSQVADTVQTYMNTQSTLLAQSVLKHIMPAIQQAIAPVLAKQAAPSAIDDAPNSPVVAPSTPVKARDPQFAPTAVKSVGQSLQPSLMSASPLRADDGVVNMPVGAAFSSFSNPTSNTAPSEKPAKAIDMSSMVFSTSSDNSDNTSIPSVPTTLEAEHSTPHPSDVKPSKKLLPGLEGAWATSTRPVEDEDPARDLFEGAIKMETSGKFLEDLEQYKAHYDPNYECQVFDPELQDPLLRETYIGLPPLPLRRVEPTYNPNENIDPDEKGGRIRFSVWPKCIENCSGLTISNAVTFERSGVFINPSRASPRVISARPTKTGSLSLRLNVDTTSGAKIAICVTSGMCMRSHVATAVKINGPLQREHKFINIVMHNQDWERWAAFMCFCFGQELLYAQITDLAIQVGTMLSKVDDTDNARSKAAENIHPELMSPIRSSSSSPTKARNNYPVKYALACEDTVPVYDARQKTLDIDDDLSKVDTLPRWKGEVPVGAFVSTYLVTYFG